MTVLYNKVGQNHVNRLRRGFTLVELLIFVAIIIIILLLILLNLKTQIARGRDAKRKADLNRIQKTFEEYYNDREQYPNGGILDNCGSQDLAPYLESVPCDPATREPYLYAPVDPLSAGYRVCTKLEDKSDPDITRIGCHPENGCGYGAGYNYCLAVGTSVTPSGFDPFAAPTPTPTPTPSYQGKYACTPGGDCNEYDNPADPKYGCPISWAFTCPAGACANSANRCRL